MMVYRHFILIYYYISEIENQVIEIASKVKELFESRCDNPIARNCSICSYDTCTNILPEFQCYSDYPTPNICNNCSQKGAYVSLEKSVIRWPKGITFQTDFDKEIACTLAQLDDVFKKRSGKLGSQYFGAINGMYRIYPGFAYSYQSQKECLTDYDPRYRPWYVQATTGAKNIIIILDTSGSMLQNTPSRLEIAKAATKSVIDTLGNQDWFGIVNFNGNASSNCRQLLRALEQNKLQITNYVNNLQANGSTNYEQAFMLAFDILDNTQMDGLGAPCQTVILFLTDGYISSGESNKNVLIEQIRQRNQKYHATIFSFSLGNDADITIPKEISCAFNGVWSQISDSSDKSILQSQMSSYYQYISMGIQITKPVWTEPFSSSNRFKGSQLIASALPVYVKYGSNTILIGVAAVDIVVNEFKKFGDYTDILNLLIQRSYQCSSSVLTTCQMEQFRSHYGIYSRCFNANNCSRIEISNEKCPISITNNPICNVSQTNYRQLCCPAESTCEYNNTQLLLTNSSFNCLISNCQKCFDAFNCQICEQGYQLQGELQACNKQRQYGYTCIKITEQFQFSLIIYFNKLLMLIISFIIIIGFK